MVLDCCVTYDFFPDLKYLVLRGFYVLSALSQPIKKKALGQRPPPFPSPTTNYNA